VEEHLPVERAEEIPARDDPEKPAVLRGIDDRELAEVAEPEFFVDARQWLGAGHEGDLLKDVLRDDQVRDIALGKRFLDVVQVDDAEQPPFLVADVQVQAPRVEKSLNDLGETSSTC
jgi:hypothetical protein